MADEFESLNSRIPDFTSAIAQRIAARNSNTSTNLPPAGTIDPYKLMLQKKQSSESNEIDPNTIIKWPEEDLNKLQDYCMKMGIVGFNCGRMSPIAALAMLKQKFGNYTDVPLEERVPEGYEKINTKSSYGPNYPYSDAVHKKQIIHG